jgi:hypothetical protein
MTMTDLMTQRCLLQCLRTAREVLRRLDPALRKSPVGQPEGILAVNTKTHPRERWPDAKEWAGRAKSIGPTPGHLG